jgi:hypothetical protein
VHPIDRPSLARYAAADFGVNLSVSASALATNLNGAVSTINGLGGGRLLLPQGQFAPSAGLTMLDKVHIEGAGIGATTLDFSGLVTPVNSAAISGSGSLTALPALASNILLNGLSIVFASAPGVVAGDVLVIYDSADFSFSTARDVYRAGEYVRVKSISGNTVTLANRTFAAYASGGTVSVYKMVPIRTGITGLSAIFKTGSSGIVFDVATGLFLGDLDLTGSDNSNLLLQRVFEGTVSRVRAVDYGASVGLNYGITISNCQRLGIVHPFLETARHGLTMGGSSETGCVPNREITVTGGVIGGHNTGGHINGCELHGNTEWVTFHGVTMPHGLTLAGDHIRTVDCDIFSGPNDLIFLSEMVGFDHEISDNRFHVRANHGAGEGQIYVLLDAVLTRAGGTLRINRNEIDLGTYVDAGTGTTQLGIFVWHHGATTNELHVEINDNDLKTAVTAAGTVYGIALKADSGKGFRTQRHQRNTLRGTGILWNGCMPDIAELDGNTITDPPQYGILTTAQASPPYTTPTMTARGNTVLRARLCNIRLFGLAGGTLILENNDSFDANQGGLGTADTGSAISVGTWGDVIYRNNNRGDRQSVPTMAGLDSMTSITTLQDLYNSVVGATTGTPAGKVRTSITTSRFARAPLTGSKTFDWASLASGATPLTTTVTVTGAALGDVARASMSVTLQGIELSAYVSATDTVTCVLRNDTGGAIDLASATLRAWVEKAS